MHFEMGSRIYADLRRLIFVVLRDACEVANVLAKQIDGDFVGQLFYSLEHCVTFFWLVYVSYTDPGSLF